MASARNKVHYFLAVLLGVSLLATGCSGRLSENQQQAAKNNESSAAPSSGGKIHIRFAQWSVPSAKLVDEAINLFNETNKDHIQIDLLKIPRDRYIETLNMLNASGKGPDVFEVTKEWLNSYIYKDWAANLSPYIDDHFLKAFPEWAVQFAGDPLFKNKFYTIPSNQITYRLIYNKDLFRTAGLNPNAPPKTLSELERYAKKISDTGKGERKYGFALPMGEEWTGLVQPMEASNAYSGVYYYNFKVGKYDLNVYKPWLNTFKSLNENGGLFPGMAFMKADLAMAQFAEGNIGMMYAESWKPSLFLEQFPPKSEWGVAMPPAIDEKSAGKGAVMISIAGLNVVNPRTTHLNEAVKVWKFLYSEEYLGQLFRKSSVIPVVKGIMENPEYAPIAANFTKFLPGSQDSVYPNTPLTMDEWQRAKAYVSGISGEQLIDKALLEESDRLNTMLNIAVAAKSVNINDFFKPKFDPRHPSN